MRAFSGIMYCISGIGSLRGYSGLLSTCSEMKLSTHLKKYLQGFRTSRKSFSDDGFWNYVHFKRGQTHRSRRKETVLIKCKCDGELAFRGDNKNIYNGKTHKYTIRWKERDNIKRGPTSASTPANKIKSCVSV